MTTKHMTEAQKVRLVRNSLLVAGHEMGAEGDHWPVIKSTIQSIEKDWENLQTERNVYAEMRTHIGKALADLEKALPLCPVDVRPQMNKMMEELWELYEAQFSRVDESSITVSEGEMPVYIKRAKTIIKTLGADDE